MKNLLILTLLISFTCESQVGYYNLGKANRVPIVPVISNIKNPRRIPNSLSQQYVAFGNNVNLGSDNSLSDTNVLFVRAGTGHLPSGVPVYNIYTISNDTWHGYNIVRTDTMDNRDVWATRMDNDTIVTWSCISHNGTYGDWGTQNYQMRFGRDLGHTDTLNFRWPATLPRLQRNYFYGKAAYLDTPGHYCIPLIQFNVDTGNVSRTRIDIIKTTDYFRTYYWVNVWAGLGFPIDESTIEYLGSGKLGLWGRIDQGSQLYYYNSSDYGNTWTAKGTADSLYSYQEGDSYMAYAYKSTTTDSTFISYGDRDADCVNLSPFNRISDFFSTFSFKGPEIYYYNRSEDAATANTSLNYSSISKIIRDSIYLITFSHEISADTAYMVYSRDNFRTDPAGVPTAPPTLTISGTTSTSFRVDIDGYSQAQKNNIRWFTLDLCTDAGFTSFVTAQYKAPGAHPGTNVIHGVSLSGFWDLFHSLTTATTYYLRIKACNNAGCSSYTTSIITTL